MVVDPPPTLECRGGGKRGEWDVEERRGTYNIYSGGRGGKRRLLNMQKKTKTEANGDNEAV